jgi:hypothetical protein
MKIAITGSDGDPISTIDDWMKHGGPKSPRHWKPDRSAYELAADWIERGAEDRIVELVSLLDEVDGVELLGGVAEKKTFFDGYSGPRNHDLLIRAQSAQGPITLGIEAKADEPFDLPLWRYREEGLKESANTKKLDRIDHLVALWFATRLTADRAEPALITIGYQLFSALAGLLADAKLDGSSLAVLVVYEFRTALTDDAEHEHNARVYEAFIERLLGSDHGRRQTADGTGWITEPADIRGDGKKMPSATKVALAKVERDLRQSSA